MSLALAALELYLRHVQKPWLARVGDPARARAVFERNARLARMPAGVMCRPRQIGGVRGLWVGCPAAQGPARDRVLLYLHGGAFVMGSPATHAALAARLCARTGAEAFLPDYRLAPEHPFPAAFDDACAAWSGLVARGYAPGAILAGGDSAGGGLALALLGALCAAGGDRPRAVFALSPWTDLTLSGASLSENAARDPLLPAERLAEIRDVVLAGADPADPRASPLMARFTGAGPVFLQAARDEILRDDTLRMAGRLRSSGVEVELDLWESAPHVLAMFQGWVPEADEAVRRLALFIRRVCGAVPEGGS